MKEASGDDRNPPNVSPDYDNIADLLIVVIMDWRGGGKYQTRVPPCLPVCVAVRRQMPELLYLPEVGVTVVGLLSMSHLGCCT